MSLEKLPDNIFLFVHIPKTGGTSFRTEIESKLKCVFEYGKNPKTSDLIRQTLEKRGIGESFSGKFLLSRILKQFYGHFPISKYLPYLGKDSKVVTFLRDPIQRTMSTYRHFCRHYGYQGSLLNFISNPAFSNEQFKKVDGLDLRKFFFVGITEKYNESIQLFNQMTGLEIQNIRVNVNSDKDLKSKYEIEEEHIQILEKINQRDIELYRQAKDMLDSRLQDLEIFE
ncbi:MAG: sulfotransferase family protein [Oscillatoriales cyanobacterium SM2_3_0]|nr:sulfotransferase family protein [Oscillatoriales cyanobacterium SM2_3_0]